MGNAHRIASLLSERVAARPNFGSALSPGHDVGFRVCVAHGGMRIGM